MTQELWLTLDAECFGKPVDNKHLLVRIAISGAQEVVLVGGADSDGLVDVAQNRARTAHFAAETAHPDDSRARIPTIRDVEISDLELLATTTDTKQNLIGQAASFFSSSFFVRSPCELFL